MPVRKERTGWRDESISRRHRDYGIKLPAVDIDFLLLEYSGFPLKIAALVEYKRYTAKPIDLQHPSMQAISQLASNSDASFFVVYYWDEQGINNQPWYFRVIPVNSHAKKYQSREMIMSELEYVTLLYRLRGLPVPNEIKPKLFNWIPF